MGLAVAGAVVVGLAAAGAVVVVVAPFPVPVFCGVAVVPAGVAVAGVGGNEVSGVGSGGKGFDRIPATSWSIPSVLSAFRNLYQVVRLSFHVDFAVAN